jgi:hypothetical protein
MNKWTKEEEQLLRDNYTKFVASELAKLVNKTESAVQGRLNKLRLLKGPHKLYSFNNNFFEIPNILNSYWAGFLAADGTIRTNCNQLCLRLCTKDVNHIEEFRNNIKYTGKIESKESIRQLLNYAPKKYFTSEMTICGAKKAINDLINNFNIGPRKSLTLTPPNLIGDNRLAYIVGYIDGDGTIRTNEKDRLEFSCVGTKEILYYIKELVDELVPSKYEKWNPKPRQRIDRGNKNHWTYKLTGFRALEFLSILNKLEVPKLQRKWSKLELAKKPIYGTCRKRKGRIKQR